MARRTQKALAYIRLGGTSVVTRLDGLCKMIIEKTHGGLVEPLHVDSHGFAVADDLFELVKARSRHVKLRLKALLHRERVEIRALRFASVGQLDCAAGAQRLLDLAEIFLALVVELLW